MTEISVKMIDYSKALVETNKHELICKLPLLFLLCLVSVNLELKRIGSVEVPQWLRALAALAEDLGLNPSTHLTFHSRLYLQFWGDWLVLLDWPGISCS